MNRQEDKIGVLLLNLGGPDSLEAVRPFLFNLFSDREIIRLGPSFMQKPLACLISSLRRRKTETYYRLIGGKSPICDITVGQARALEEELNKNAETDYNRSTSHGFRPMKVYIGMRYWRPLIEEVVPQIHNEGVSKLIVLGLYPQYSIATTGSSYSKLKAVVSRYPIEIYAVSSWYDNQLYIDALAEKIKKGIESFGPHPGPDLHVLFSAHSLPVKFIEEGDPYVEQIRGTIFETAKRIRMNWHLSYQSKSGPVKWLEPSTDSMIKELAGKGVKNLLAVPVSFVSDHIETLYEIDVLYKSMAASLGMRLERTESLNTSPLFISALKEIVLQARKEAGWAE